MFTIGKVSKSAEPYSFALNGKSMVTKEQLIEVYEWVQKLAHHYCLNVQDAEDLAADTMLKLAQSDYDNSKALKPYCKAIMQNTYITQYNRRANIPFVGMEDILIEPPASCHTSSRVEIREIFRAIHRSSQFSCCIKSVVLYAKGYSYIEIAHRLKIPVGTVRSRISTGRDILKKMLEV